MLSRSVRTYAIEVDEQELGALERACYARIREMAREDGLTEETIGNVMPARLLKAIKEARAESVK